MIIIKVISLALDIQNCINIYTDPENIRQIIIDRYEGRCITGCYIKEVGRILRTGECVINQDGPPSFGVMPVTFEVTAIVYAVGEIINGCVVKNRDSSTGILICSSDLASIMVSPNPLLESISKGQIISVRVGAVKYNISSNRIAISAIPYLFSNKVSIYKITPIDATVKEFLTSVIDRIAYEEGEVKRFLLENSKAWETFDKLLYAYKEIQPVPKGVKMVDINTLLEVGAYDSDRYISRDSRIKLSTPNVFMYSSDSLDHSSVRVDIPTSNVFMMVLEDYCEHLRTIREMINVYSTDELIRSHSNLWQIFKKIKF